MLKAADIFQSNMVLQRDKPLPVWGVAQPGTPVSVSIQGQHTLCVADHAGRWQATLPPLHTSEDDTLAISDGDEQLRLRHVAVGEVWIAGGQSNMEFQMRYEKHLETVKPKCANPHIRFYDVPEVAFEGQKEQFDYSRMGIWRTASPEDIEYFSAVGYYFQRALEQDLRIPVGIVGCNWGGSVSASWMNPETVRKAGPAWMEEYEAFAARTSWEDYLAGQRASPLNDRGNPFADPFNELVMPRTPGPEELAALFASAEEAGMRPDPNTIHVMPHLLPGALYQHMLKEIAPFPVRGVLWYQGESDDEMHHADLYAPMLTGLISDWRALWKDASLPFLLVQLPGYERWMQNENDRFDLIRAAQEQVSKDVPNTWLCSISDIGEQFDIHPKNKLPVGERLALLARGHIYGEDILCDAPAASHAERAGDTVTLAFDHAEGGLLLKGEVISALRVFSGDRELRYQAEVAGASVILHLDGAASEPIHIDFAKDKFYLVNLFNQAGIPAIPFSVKMESEG